MSFSRTVVLLTGTKKIFFVQFGPKFMLTLALVEQTICQRPKLASSENSSNNFMKLGTGPRKCIQILLATIQSSQAGKVTMKAYRKLVKSSFNSLLLDFPHASYFSAVSLKTQALVEVMAALQTSSRVTPHKKLL